jgi:hypothetical protein
MAARKTLPFGIDPAQILPPQSLLNYQTTVDEWEISQLFRMAEYAFL